MHDSPPQLPLARRAAMRDDEGRRAGERAPDVLDRVGRALDEVGAAARQRPA